MDPGDAYDLGVEAYTYLYPLVLMDTTRRQLTNVEQAGQVPGRAPMNAFSHMRQFPSADFRAVVKPNFDTLYSTAWLDLTDGPMVLSVPDSQGRYYLLPMLTMWTDVFTVPGPRTTGTGAQSFALAGPGWSGRIPAPFRRIDCTTPYVWLIGRTQCRGPSDYEAVHTFQDGLTLTPLSRGTETARPVRGEVDPAVDNTTPPPQQVFSLGAADFFGYAADLLKRHPPVFTDHPVLDQLRSIGFVAGDSFDLKAADTVVREALVQAVPEAQKQITDNQKTIGTPANGWQMVTTAIGVYGADYPRRATIALTGLGANRPEDAVYPITYVDSDNRPLTGANRYTLRFDADAMPPARAFWSVTLYDAEGHQVPNPINRFSLGSMDDPATGEDGSIDLYVQHEEPGDKDAGPNWLPAPTGAFNLCLRLYYTEPAALDGSWSPPPVTRTG